MRTTALLITLVLPPYLKGAEVESRVLTTYLPQDFLENAVRAERWTEIVLNVKGGVHKGDTIRLWGGGRSDPGNGDEPGENVNGPEGVLGLKDAKRAWALSTEARHAYALLFRTEM